jgi:hypothetical protein
MVDRWSFRAVGERNGPTCVPLEWQAGLIEGATPQLAFAVAQGYAKAPIRRVEQDLRAAHRNPPSRSTLERMALRIGTQVRAASAKLEGRLRSDETLPDGAVAVNLGLDRTTVPMAEDEVSGEPAKSKRVLRYRMAYVGTFTVTDRDSQVLLVRRYASPAHAGAASILNRMRHDLRRALQQNAGLNIGVVQDGASELWHRMRVMLFDELKVPGRGWGIHLWRRLPWRETIDWYHLMEHLSSALQVLLPNEQQRHRLLSEWKALLSRDDGGIKKIANQLQQLAAGSSHATSLKVHNVVNYISVPWLFRYASLKNLGLHRGSGVTEGACKSLIAKRTKRSGQRFRPRGISSVLAVRSLLDSDRLPQFWEIFARRYVSPCIAA